MSRYQVFCTYYCDCGAQWFRVETGDIWASYPCDCPECGELNEASAVDEHGEEVDEGAEIGA